MRLSYLYQSIVSLGGGMLDHIHLHNFNQVGVQYMRNTVMTTLYHLAIPLSLTTTHIQERWYVTEPYGTHSHPINSGVLLTQIQGISKYNRQEPSLLATPSIH